MDFKFTRALFELRRDIDDTPDAVSEELKSLVDMRVKARTYEGCIGIDHFKELWDFCTDLPRNSAFHLPPLYLENETLRYLMSDIIEQLHLRENQRVNNETNVGHRLISGVKGVGKTTILRAVAMGVCVLMHRLVPITFEFEKTDHLLMSPLRMCTEVLQWIDTSKEFHQGICASSVVTEFDRLGHSVCFIFDEIQKLYRKEVGEGVNYTTEIARFSRLGQTFGVLSGTAVNLEDYLFYSPGNTLWEDKGYPNFNHTLYVCCRIPALRTVKELQNYVKVRYRAYYERTPPDCRGDDMCVLLCFTGGIGRLVDQVILHVEAGSRSSSRSISDEVEFLRRNCKSSLEESLHKCIDEVPDCAEIFSMLLQQPGYQVLFDEDEAGSEQKQRAQDRLPCDGRLEGYVVDSLTMLGHSRLDSHRLITDCIQRGLLYKHPKSNCIEFVRPCDAAICLTFQNWDTRIRIVLSIIRIMLKGVFVHQDEARVYVNAGRVLEDAVRGGVFRGAGVAFKHRTVRIDSDGNLIVSFKDGHMGKMRDLDPESFMDEMLEWVGEKGVDGFYLTRDSNGWVLVVWQCKGGAENHSIGGGSMDTAIKNFTSNSCRLNKINDAQIGGIAVKLSVGVAVLLRSLACCNIDVVEVRAHLHSTKIVTASLETFHIPNGVRYMHTGSPSIRAAFTNVTIGMSTEAPTIDREGAESPHMFAISKDGRIRVCHRSDRCKDVYLRYISAAASETGTEAFKIAGTSVTYTLDIRERNDVGEFAQVRALFAKQCATLLHALFISFNLDVQRIVGVVLVEAGAVVLTSCSCPAVNTEVVLNLAEEIDECGVFCSKELDTKLETCAIDLSITCGIDWIIDAVDGSHRNAARKILKDNDGEISLATSLSHATLSDKLPPTCTSTQNKFSLTAASRPLQELISALREAMGLTPDEKMINVLRRTMVELDVEEECSKLKTVLEKAKFLVEFLGV
jgi:hypothetical protein